MTTVFTTRRAYTRPGKINNASGDFVCLSCGAIVSVAGAMSGVRNRNHCPYCLASRHLDQFEPGDRLSACKARMIPVGLTFKRIAKKYTGNSQGELMLVHLCEDCRKVSINRIAADDDGEMILAVLAVDLDQKTRDLLAQHEVMPLSPDQAHLVHQCLFGAGDLPDGCSIL